MLDKQKNQGTNQFYLRNVNVRWGTFDLSDLLQMPFEEDEDERYSIRYGDLVVCEGGEPGRCAIWNNQESIKFQKALHRVRCFDGILNQYIKTAIEAFSSNKMLDDYYTGSTIKHLTGDALNTILIPLPPIIEQQRIVGEIEKWYALIERLETNKLELKEVINQAKRKVLDLAIHGKLVPQDPSDEPAIELLKRINPNFISCDTFYYWNIPASWCICSLKDVFDITMGTSPNGSALNKHKNGIEFHQGKICFSDMYLEKSDIYTSIPIKLAEAHSILLCVRAPVGIVNITERKICIGRGLCSLKPKAGIDFMFAFYALQTHKDHFDEQASGSTFKAIGGDIIKGEVFALPPYKEQVRIREKIESILQQLNTIITES